MIASGKKREEYREIKEYWERRFKFYPIAPHDYDFVQFTNGYQKNSRQMMYELISIRIDRGKVKWGAVKHKLYYVLKLGNEISRKNF